MKIFILAALVFSLAIFGCTSTGNQGGSASVKPTDSPNGVKGTATPSATNFPAASGTPTTSANELEALQTESTSNSVLTEVSDIDAVISDIDALIIKEGIN